VKIVFISPSFYPATYYGGPIFSTYELAKALKRNGVDVRVITTNANGNEKLNRWKRISLASPPTRRSEPMAEIKTGVFHKLENDLPVKYYKSVDSRGTSLSMILNLKKEIKDSDIVYLVSIFSAPTPFTIFLCKLYKKPLIISPRGQLGKWCLAQGNKFKKLWLRTFVQPNVKYLNWHLTSETEQQSVHDVYPTAKTFVIPNGVSPEPFSVSDKPKVKTFYRKYTGFDCSKKKIIISMGRLQKVKGFDILISSMSKVQCQDVVLLIAGEDFGEKQKLDLLIEESGLRDRVFLIGMIEGEEKIEFLRNADVFALASHHENFGMVYAEALAAGTPVVASKNTPWQDVEKHNCGKWVENNPAEFAEAINKVLNTNPEQMGKNGSKYIKDNFSWEKIAYNFQQQIERSISTNANGK
jgi:glycosyltransferase involved in cell wall biosynthesis